MDLNEHVRLLFAKYIRKECSKPEFEELLSWLVAIDDEEKNALSGPIQELWDQAHAGKLPSTADQVNWDQVYDRILTSADQTTEEVPVREPVTRRIGWRRIAAAAVILGMIISGSLYLLNRKSPAAIVKTVNKTPHLPEEIVSGGNHAMLTLSNGSVIILDSTKNGMITRQGNVKIIKLDSGQLAYTSLSADGSTSVETGYNTITTPRAAQYQIVLSDGTKVWLNAASSLRYPTIFTGKTRDVTLTGEGYFEVAKNRDKPFHVQIADLEVEVLGTHFNIMAYEDEDAIQTTLLEGAVKVIHRNQSDILAPGKQASLQRDNNKLTVGDANIQKAVAWKNGYFYFDKSDVKAIMRQVSRWYDLDIVYESPAPDMKFSGKIERDLPLSGITHLLESGQIHFRIEGKKCILTK